ncbi:NADH-ubiquinone oxidoreductase 21.3 kDa subunit [Blumeria hordei DH14]|uniref:NADH-ubiquinone oxidoreductase 21.3 kDa subunit n=1 Tax=Blumeria graminis f. sp. hordei (strain DH14) TaxID=546991 RepID=N1JDY4_BLUG1|nr:NADH-ubiquinone oxidoreductase 21.3 kDa subunit [Blumeria hordei DH14]
MSTIVAEKAAQATARVIPVHKKYTLQSYGIWERIRRIFAVDSSRSNGVPLNPQFRNPPPGSNEPFSFIDPVTVPAGDIADNPYWKRDMRRNYPKLSFITQNDAVGLLSLGSRNDPKNELIGESGIKALVDVKKEGELGLAAYFQKEGKTGTLAALGKDGMPPFPCSVNLKKQGADKYELTAENSYPESYPCRSFK